MWAETGIKAFFRALCLTRACAGNTKTTSLCLERVMGIEPTSSAWKAEVLPLNYTRLTLLHPLRKLVEGVGFEPTKA